jgi:hypothetical protein
MNKIYPAIISVILLTTSCITTKKPVRKILRPDKNAITKRYGVNTVDTVFGVKKPAEVKPAKGDQKKQLIAAMQPLLQKELQFNTFTGKAKMHYEGLGQKQEFMAHFRIQKDKIIWVNITALGGMVNVARAYITPDSIFAVNFLQREAYKMHISEANKLLPVPVDFKILQRFITGDVIQQGGVLTDAADLGNTLQLQAESSELVQQLTYNKQDNTLRSLQMLSRNENGPSGMMQYGNYENIGGRMFSQGRIISITNKGEPYYLDMVFSNVEFDKTIDFPFSIPKNYRLK